MTIDPRQVVLWRDHGMQNVAAQVHPVNYQRFLLLFARMHFQDRTHTATVVTADVVISQITDLDNTSDTFHDSEFTTVRGRGLSNDMNLRLDERELLNWIVGKRSALKFAWTNPDSGKILWGLEVGMLLLPEPING